jgi:hypothetical protein
MNRGVEKVMAMMAIGSAIACKRTPDAVPDPAASSAKPAPVATTSAMGQSAPVASAEPAPSASAPSTPTASPPERLYKVLDSKYAFTFIPGTTRALLADEEGSAFELREGSLVPASGFFDGLTSYMRDNPTNKLGNLESFGGRLPNQVYAIIGVYALRGTSDPQVHLWRGGTWKEAVSAGNANMAHITAVEPYNAGLAVAIVDVTGQVRLETESGSLALRKAAKGREGETRMRELVALYAPPGGGLVAFGSDSERDGANSVELFGDDKSSKAIVALPEVDQPDIAGPNVNELYIAGVTRAPRPAKPAPAAGASASAAASAAPAGASANAAAAPPPDVPGRPYFAVLQGNSWVPRTGPGAEPITSLTAAPDGSLWATSGGGVWRRPRGGAWSRVALPEGAQANAVFAVSASDVWALDRQKEHLQVFASKPSRWPLVMNPPEGEAPKAPPATASCATPFVLMYVVNSDKVGTGYDFPLTRKALKGHTELAGMALVLTEHYQVGAVVPSLEMGEKLAAVIRDNVKGQKPQVVCMAPRVRAEIPVDLATGELKR